MLLVRPLGNSPQQFSLHIIFIMPIRLLVGGLFYEKNTNENLHLNVFRDGGHLTQDDWIIVGYARKLDVETSFAHKQNTGYDTDGEGAPRHDSVNIDVARFSTETDLSKTLLLSTRFGIVEAELDDQFGDSGQVSFPDIKEKAQFAEFLLSRDITPVNRLDLTFYATHFDRRRGWPYPRFYSATNCVHCTTLIRPMRRRYLHVNGPQVEVFKTKHFWPLR